jgi:hypothetical protein
LSFEWLEKLSLAAILASFVFNLRSVFTVRFTPEAMGKEYESFLHGGSFFSDDKLYAWAGWLYIHGHLPNEVNFEHPPLAKYFIGLSEVVFGNHVLLSLVFSILTLIIVFFLSRFFIKNPLFALFPVFMLSLDKLFVSFSSSSMLDVYLLFFSSLSAFIFVKALRDRRFTPLFYVAVGLAIACKWIGIFILLSMLAYCLLRRDKWNLKFLPFGIALSLVTYAFTYIAFFLAGQGLQDFVSLQLKMYRFQHFMRFERGTPPPFWILLHFLTGIEGPAEFATVEIIEEAGKVTVRTLSVKYGLSLIKAFNPLTWPASFSSSIMSLYYARKKGDAVFLIVPIAFFSLLALISFGQVFVWYILPGLPFAFISLAYFIESIYKESKNKKAVALFILAYTIALSIWSIAVQLPSFLPFPIK